MHFIFLIILLISLITPLFISLVTYKITYKYYPKKALMLALIIFITPYIFLASLVFIANNPDEDFYAEEFQKITELILPEDIYFEHKEATYPFIHNDYKSSATIRLKQDDFEKILFQTKKSSKLKEYTNLTDSDLFLYQATSDIDGEYHYIGFKNDYRTIIISLVNY